MKRYLLLFALCACGPAFANDGYRSLPVEEYLSRMQAGWIGQMAGVGWGAPTEFQFNGHIAPAEAVPGWEPVLVNQFWQDDLYVEMTFLKSLEERGWDLTHKEAGVDFATSGYPLWHANAAGRANLRAGIAPPDSGHPQFNAHADDIDYQIEADFSGLIAPGMPNVPLALGEVFGRIMNYGDGVYGGQFVGAMYATAFFESDPETIIRQALAYLPEDSQYAECVRDILAWWRAAPRDWEATWALIEAKYNEDPNYRRASCGGARKDFNIDAKINGAYIVMGLLYGHGDPDRTIEIAMRCGQDSDCNPSSAAGVLFATLGMDKVPDKFKSALQPDGVFTHTEYSFAEVLRVCEKLAREAVVRQGGRIEVDADGREIFWIRNETPEPAPLEQSWNPGPIANSRYTQAELEERILSQPLSDGRPDMHKIVAEFAPGWNIEGCGLELDPGIREHYRGRENVLVTHPDDSATPCILWRDVEVSADAPQTLHLVVSHHDGGDWQLIVKVDGETQLDTPISANTVTGGWRDVDINLSPFAGKTVKLEVLNEPTGWFCEAAYWGQILLGEK